jgi:molybdopterin synthase catalytic subunit
MTGSNHSETNESNTSSRSSEDNIFVDIVDQPISPEQLVRHVKTDNSGCVATYVGLIRNESHGKPVLSVEYQNDSGKAREHLGDIAREIIKKYPVNKVGIIHRIGVLKVGEINFVAAIAAGHRHEGFAACQYAVDRFKELLPTKKIEKYIE